LTISSIRFLAGFLAEPSRTIAAAIYAHRGIVRAVPGLRTPISAICAAAIALAIGIPPASGGAGSHGCSAFESQAAAQVHFARLGGRPSHNVERLDGDGDGVACEGSPGPYAGYATIGYSRAKGFFFGTASMPSPESGEGFACMLGNQHFPDGPRQLTVYRVRPGADRAISPALGTEARQDDGRLLWKFEKDLVPGRYYAAFDARQRESPYEPPECPGFRSRETQLPRGAAPKKG
jgi:hypothetical protein